ncbi:peptidylprolyl isomerase domain and WD-repeat protein 1 [Kwoniella heveanensis BCC8398]|uniref:peptidylprolyl isomerase n=1 Tax=Kwoniella heveanensis BCC8398 TaxID=1296120 RepID=A0A1B9GWK4_9TREE|nr:peptidylprolyl isomerase domain and WD-repeat protein 1 [Kwoniella heveanensis BCC8398]
MSEDAGPSSLGKRARETSPASDVNGKSNGDTNGGFKEEDVPEMPPADMDDSSDEEIGPMPGGGTGAEVVVSSSRKKKRAVLPHERLYLASLPDTDRYYKSFMHREAINSITTTRTNFIVTTSVDGHLKLWKKQDQGIEFVKHYRASLKTIVGTSASDDGKLFATVSEGGEGRVFDVVNFDMINILKFPFTPKTCCWVHEPGAGQALLAVSETDSPTIRIYDGRGDGEPLYTLEKLHRAPVHLMVYTAKYDCVVSADEEGFVEYWQPSEPWGLPSAPGLWQYKSSTDLFHFKKTKTLLTSLTFSPNSSHFATLALPSRSVHIFNFLTGKLTRTYDESLTAVIEMQQAGTAVYKLDDMDFGRRLAVERELDRSESGPGGMLRTANAVWDESGNFVLYPTMLGIKVVNTVTNKVARVLGKDETLRFLNLSLYQGAPAKKGVTTLQMAASANPLLQEKASRDPHLFATAYKKQRFYLFARGDKEESKGDRDVFNERPTREEQTVAVPAAPEKSRALATRCTIHTTKGDITIQLFPDLAPKTVENFITHARNGYYNGTIFHRVIKKFMIQGGDPLGDGTGGESIWGGTFEDEISPKARHDRPFTLSMANAGPGTNGSQFFITTVPCQWLDGKHTVFGRAVGGLDVISTIEDVRVGKNDKPFDDISMSSITVE